MMHICNHNNQKIKSIETLDGEWLWKVGENSVGEIVACGVNWNEEQQGSNSWAEMEFRIYGPVPIVRGDAVGKRKLISRINGALILVVNYEGS